MVRASSNFASSRVLGTHIGQLFPLPRWLSSRCMRRTGETALVTGAGRGLGKACALELARQGADLVLNDRPASPDLSQTAAEVHALGRSCTAIEADVFNRAGCEELVSKSLEA